MKLLRLVMGLVGTLLLGGGYFASQAAYHNGTVAQYIQALDSSPVPMVSLVLLVGAVILAFIPDREENEEVQA